MKHAFNMTVDLNFKTNQPPPGAYDPFKDTKVTKTNGLGLDSWTLAAAVNRAPTSKVR